MRLALILVLLGATAAARPLVVDGSVAGRGTGWSSDCAAISDGDDARSPPTGYEFTDIEDIDSVLLWVDPARDSLYVAWRTMQPPYPNRQLVDWTFARDVGTFGILIDVDADAATGASSARTLADLPSYATPVIGAEIGLTFEFERIGGGPLVWTSRPWPMDEWSRTSPPVAGRAAFGVTFDGSCGGPNARWTEAAWSLHSLREIWEPLLGRQLLRRGDLIAVAGVLATPVPFGMTGEEITNGGCFLVDWGPVERRPDVLVTKALRDSSGHEVVAAGLPIRYDPALDAFVVGSQPTPSPLADYPYGDVSHDGTLSAYDASLILRHAVGLLPAIDVLLGDVSGNGAVTAYDAALVLHRTIAPGFRLPVEGPAGRRAWDDGDRGWSWTPSACALRCEGIWAADLAIVLAGDGADPVAITGAAASAQRRVGDVVRIALVGSDDALVRVVPPRGTQIAAATAAMNERRLAPASDAEGIVLCRPQPSPFNGCACLRYRLPDDGEATLAISDALGRPVRTLAQGLHSAGWHEVTWDGLDDRGRPAASGVYAALLRAGTARRVQRIILVR